MLDAQWIVSLIAGVLLISVGILAMKKSPGSIAAISFMIAIVMIIVAMMVGHDFDIQDRSHADTANVLVKIYVAAVLLSLTLLTLVAFLYPLEREIRLRPPNALGLGFALAVIFSIVGGSLAQSNYNSLIGTTPTRFTAVITLIGFVSMIAIVMTSTLASRSKATDYARHSSTLYMLGLMMVAVCGSFYSIDIIIGHKHDPSLEPLPSLLLIGSIMLVSMVYALSMARGQMSIGVSPVTEGRATGTKSKSQLLQRRAYLVEESRPEVSFRLFADILIGRCFDCEDDESFSCESVGCSACNLPCPCSKCKKHKSRPQGLIITRQFPNEVRGKYSLHTTPILWLSTIPGNESIDPTKLSLLTDRILNYMEKSENGIVMVDGMEYLVTSNDFHRVLKAVEMWTEGTMASATSLILSIDPKAFGEKDLAVLERGREVMRSNSNESRNAAKERT